MVVETYVLSGSWSRIANLGGRDPVNVTGDARIHTSIIWRSTTIAPARDSHLNPVNKKRSATVTLYPNYYFRMIKIFVSNEIIYEPHFSSRLTWHVSLPGAAAHNILALTNKELPYCLVQIVLSRTWTVAFNSTGEMLPPFDSVK